ncbi:hypothetical protein CAJAP_06990 [Camponotus japonicus]
MSQKAKLHSDRCCNPYNFSATFEHKNKSLRNISKAIKRQFPELHENSKICCKCRKYDENSYNTDNEIIDNDSNFPIDVESEARSQKNDNDSSSSIDANDSVNSTNSFKNRSQREVDLEEILDNVKQKFWSLPVGSQQRVQILTILPTSWSSRKIATEFNCSRAVAQKSKEFRASAGILGSCTIKTGKKISADTEKKILDFYNSDLNSREMAAVKDVISVKTDDKRILMQKRLLLLDLKGLFSKYIDENDKNRVSFSKFAQLRPKNCILAGASGTHSVCVCTIHQNCKLMLDSVNVEQLTNGTDNKISTYKDCLKQMVCDEKKASCNLDECSNCPGTLAIAQNLLKCLEKKNIENVQFSSWTNTDRSTLQTLILPIDDFVQDLSNKLHILKPHSYIAKQQTQYFDEKRRMLSPGEVIVGIDFAENFKYVVQDAAQAVHFNNDQCSICTVVYYYKEKSELLHKSLVFLSDCTKHDTAAVYTVQTLLLPHIEENVKNVKKIVYVSDGAKQHFKNRFQMVNLVNHASDFGIPAEWHCHATAHGKSTCDGVGAAFKRAAAKQSLLAKPQDSILDSKSLFDWGKNYFKNIKIFHYSNSDHERTQRRLKNRFIDAQAIPDIQKSHSFEVLPGKKLLVKRYSYATSGNEVTYT